MCAECHSTNLQQNYDIDTDSFNTTYSEINVACESCHGQAKKHIDWTNNKPLDENTHILNGVNQTQQLNQCAGCQDAHSLKLKFDDNRLCAQ